MTLPVAIVVRVGGEYGTGHLKRAQLIQQKLLQKRFPTILFIEQMPEQLPFGFQAPPLDHYCQLSSLWREEETSFPLARFAFFWETFIKSIHPDKSLPDLVRASPIFSVILVDGRDHDREQLKPMRHYSRFLLLYDDMGTARELAHACLDVLVDRQKLMPCAGQSLSGWPYLVLNPPSPKPPAGTTKNPDIVILTGQNDPFSLEHRLLSFLGSQKLLEGNRLNLSLFLSYKDLFRTMKTKLPALQSDKLTVYFYGDDYGQLQGLLKEAKVLVSYFSLTLFEAWLMDTLPVLYAPRPYHKRLSEQLLQQSRLEGATVFFPGKEHNEDGYADLLLALQWTIKHYPALTKTRTKAPKGLDYGGAERIAQFIQKTSES